MTKSTHSVLTQRDGEASLRRDMPRRETRWLMSTEQRSWYCSHGCMTPTWVPEQAPDTWSVDAEMECFAFWLSISCLSRTNYVWNLCFFTVNRQFVSFPLSVFSFPSFFKLHLETLKSRHTTCLWDTICVSEEVAEYSTASFHSFEANGWSILCTHDHIGIARLIF